MQRISRRVERGSISIGLHGVEEFGDGVGCDLALWSCREASGDCRQDECGDAARLFEEGGEGLLREASDRFFWEAVREERNQFFQDKPGQLQAG